MKRKYYGALEVDKPFVKPVGTNPELTAALAAKDAAKAAVAKAAAVASQPVADEYPETDDLLAILLG